MRRDVVDDEVKICLVDARHPSEDSDGAATYVPQLAPALAEAQRLTVVRVGTGPHEMPRAANLIRKVADRERPEVIHLNNLAGAPLATVMWAAGNHVPLAISLHDGGLLRSMTGFNRWLTGRVGLVISPTHDLLDQHLERGFFRRAIQQILPYGIEPGPAPRPRPVKDTFDVFFLDPSMSGEARRARLEYTECVILPFLRPERFLVTIQEAFQSGAVVIAARVGALTEMVRDGVNGILVEPGDHAAIDAAIRRVQESPELAARLRAAAVETVRLYDMRFHIDRLSDAYQRLVTASRAGDLDRPAA